MSKLYTIRIKGQQALAAKLGALPDQYLQALQAALFVEAEETMTASRPLVPKDRGPLQSSGFVNLPEIRRGNVVVRLGYGGPAGSGRGATNRDPVGYATHVHRDSDTFGTTPGGGGRNHGSRAIRRGRRRDFVGHSHYLSVALRQRRAGRMERIAAQVRRRLTR